MYKALCVGETGYYKFRRNIGKHCKDAVLSAILQEILYKSPHNDNYGIPCMQLALSQRGFKPGVRRITRIIRENGWFRKHHRKPNGLTYSTTEVQEKENLIKQDFSSDKSHSKMFTDISRIQCMYGRLYISPIMDCYNGEILSLEMRDKMKKELCIDTFINTIKRYDVHGGILHSD